MLHYILQITAFQLFFLIIYDVFLKRETFFNWNRVYLLATSALSLVLPFIKIQSFNAIVPKEFVLSLPEVIIGNLVEEDAVQVVQLAAVESSKFHFSWEHVFYLGVFISLSIFLMKLIKIGLLVYKNPKYWRQNLRIVTIFNSNTAFSFFYYVFLGEYIKVEDQPSIIMHEAVHVNQRHSIDLIFFEGLRIIFWFNPLVYIYQNRMTALHEYIADAEAVKTTTKNEYYQDLLGQIFETEKVSFINTFYKKSLIKKRIAMLGKTKSKKSQLVKYTMLIPMVFGMLLYTSLSAKEENKFNSSTQGHGEQFELDKEAQYNKNVIDLMLKDPSIEENNLERGLASIKNNHSKEEVKLPVSPKTSIYNNNSLQRSKKDQLQAPNEVPFSIVDEVPTLPKCVALNAEIERKSCVINEISEFVQKNFNVELANTLGLSGKQRISTIFKIDTNGDVTSVKARAPHPELQEEAIRVIKTLPQFKAGKQSGVKVIVPYSLPIIFQVDSNSKSNTNTKVEKVLEVEDIGNLENELTEVSFSDIDEVPVFPGCENIESEEGKRKCMVESISKFVVQRFNVNIAKEEGLIGRQRIAVLFKIDKEGNVDGIKSRAANQKVQAEAKRVISLLPKMIPGKHKGNAVVVPYSLPIVFQVHGDTKAQKEVAFADVDKVPIFNDCESNTAQDAQKECVSNIIIKSVLKSFNTGIADDLNLKGKQRIVVVFNIGINGDVEIKEVKAPHPDLKAEAIRSITLLPKFRPGEHKGEKVNVSYTLPIVFQVQE